MARFSTFKKATPWAAPKLAQATAFQGDLDAKAAARDNEIRAQNQMGLAKGYQHFTKDMETDPIADALRGGYDKMMGHGEGISTADTLGAGGENIGTMGEYALGETTGANAGVTTADTLAGLETAKVGGDVAATGAALGEGVGTAGLESALAAVEAAKLGGAAGTGAAGAGAAGAGTAAAAVPAATAATGAGAGATAGMTGALASNPVGWGVGALLAAAAAAAALRNR